MGGMRSSYARRRNTGRKPHKLLIRQHPVHVRRHRRFRGIHGQVAGSAARNHARAMALVAKRRAERIAAGKLSAKSGHKKARKKSSRRVKPRSAASLRRAAALRALNRKLHPRKKAKAAKKRVVPKGLHRRFLGRKKSTHKRVVPKGLHRKFNGRKKSLKPRVRKIGTKKTVVPPRGAAISAQSYISMF